MDDNATIREWMLNAESAVYPQNHEIVIDGAGGVRDEGLSFDPADLRSTLATIDDPLPRCDHDPEPLPRGQYGLSFSQFCQFGYNNIVSTYRSTRDAPDDPRAEVRPWECGSETQQTPPMRRDRGEPRLYDTVQYNLNQ